MIIGTERYMLGLEYELVRTYEYLNDSRAKKLNKRYSSWSLVLFLVLLGLYVQLSSCVYNFSAVFMKKKKSTLTWKLTTLEWELLYLFFSNLYIFVASFLFS